MVQDSIACCSLEWFHTHRGFVVAVRWLQQSGPLRKDDPFFARLGGQGLERGISPCCWSFWQLDSIGLRMTSLYICWVLYGFPILSPPTSSQVVYKGPLFCQRNIAFVPLSEWTRQLLQQISHHFFLVPVDLRDCAVNLLYIFMNFSSQVSSRMSKWYYMAMAQDFIGPPRAELTNTKLD